MQRPEATGSDDAARGSDDPGPRSGHAGGGIFRGLRRLGGEMVAVALGRLIDASHAAAAPPTDGTGRAAPTDGSPAARPRVGALHEVAEKLRGAADAYLAAKMDELEARVDAKLDEIEARIDAKMSQIHAQLGELRDRELRHRLRLLKLTLIFTLLVALLSLGYKWAARLLGS